MNSCSGLITSCLLTLCFSVISYGQAINIECAGKFDDGQPDSFEINVSGGVDRILRVSRRNSDGSIALRVFPSEGEFGRNMVPQIDFALIVFCYVAPFHGVRGSKSCNEIDRRSGRFEGVNYYVKPDGDTKRSVLSSGSCQARGQSQNKF